MLLISIEDDILIVNIYLDYGGSGYCFQIGILYLPSSFTHHSIMSYHGYFLYDVMIVGQVHYWKDLQGKSIRMKIK